MADLYQHAGWNILARRLRGPGCEIDLAVAKDSIGRVIEVKGRSGLGLTLAQSQLDSICSAKKLKALSRGVELLHRRLDRSHESLEWTADLILLSPEKHGQSCLMHLWPDIFSH